MGIAIAVLGETDSILASICLSSLHPNKILEPPQTCKSSFVAFWQQTKGPIMIKRPVQSLTALSGAGTR